MHLSRLEELRAAGVALGEMRLRGDAGPGEPQAPGDADGGSRHEYRSYKLRTLHKETEAQRARSTHQLCEWVRTALQLAFWSCIGCCGALRLPVRLSPPQAACCPSAPSARGCTRSLAWRASRRWLG